MTTINAINILIDRNPMTKIPKTAWAWEVPLYRSQYGDEAVQIIGEPVPRPVAEVPDAHDEFARLRGIFGVDADTKQSHTELVYGRGLDGVEKLGKAIKAWQRDVKVAMIGSGGLTHFTIDEDFDNALMKALATS